MLSNFSKKKWRTAKHACCLSIYFSSTYYINARWISICCVGSRYVSVHCTSAYCVIIYCVRTCCASTYCASSWKINIFICNHKNILASSSVLMPICGKKNDDADSINVERKRKLILSAFSSKKLQAHWWFNNFMWCTPNVFFHLVVSIPT